MHRGKSRSEHAHAWAARYRAEPLGEAQQAAEGRSRHGKCAVDWTLDFTTTPAPSPATHAASPSRPHPTLSRPILRMYSPRPRVLHRTYTIPRSSTTHRHQLDCRIHEPDARLKALANCCIVADTGLVTALPLPPTACRTQKRARCPLGRPTRPLIREEAGAREGSRIFGPQLSLLARSSTRNIVRADLRRCRRASSRLGRGLWVQAHRGE